MKKYLILPLSILWITNVYSYNSNITWLARKMLPFFEEKQNNNNNKGKDSMHFFITHTLPNLNASMWLHRQPRSRNAKG